MRLVTLHSISKNNLNDFFSNHWGSNQMITSHGVYDCNTLEGFAVLSELDNIIGLVTYTVEENCYEIISLDSLEENRGIGTMLLHKVETVAQMANKNKVSLITTNDNLHALLFYQKKGYQITRVYPNAVEKAREIKPQIPKLSNEGIPIRDELLLEKILY
ncbi:GNAT family N-acetyltransferase [Paenibacillus wenxiniae]|uniref:GNAT family N-acetyltransferase n=1 Tax=Paenibacillus wenxiniae TaxID=1636843 RepID=A0ABW4RQC2_9BACL